MIWIRLSKKKFTKSTWYDRLINFIPVPIKRVGDMKDGVMSPLKKAQARVIVNKSVSKMCMVVERNQEN